MHPDKPGKTVLLCDEEPDVRHCIEAAIESFGYSVQSVRDADEVLSFFRDSEIEISAIFLGLARLDRCDLDTLREIRAIDSQLPVVIVAGQWSARDVVAALKGGATDFLCKSILREELTSVLTSVLTSTLETGSTVCKPVPKTGGSPWHFRSANRLIKEIESGVAQIGRSGVPVLIQGETGSGKEVLARKLHAQSTRANKPFLKLNCAALPSELVESELFGYERGAFTGAFERKAGIFELADRGTILLDEIGDMDIRLQAKLLQVLQDQEFRRIGGKETVKVNVRVLAATHRDLEKAIHDRAFREDLYYRLNVIVLQVPPLRERTEDIVALGEYLMRKHAEPDGPIPAISADLRHAMLVYNWPGNVRELENYMRKLVIFQNPDAIARDLHAGMGRKPAMSERPRDNQVVVIGKRDDETPAFEAVTRVTRQAETDAILAALASTRWNRKQAAGILKIEYKSLLYKMKKLGLDDSPALLSPRPTPVPHQASA